jgi:co-chaperonin GroES (HSP10)
MNKNFPSNAGQKIKPIHKKVLIKLDLLEEKSEGGIILTANLKNKIAINRGTVLALGEDVAKISPELQIGDHVMFDEYHSGQTDDPEYILIDVTYIWLIMEKENND